MFGHIIKDVTNFLSGGLVGSLKPPPEARKPPVPSAPKTPPTTNPRERPYPITVMPVPISVKEVDASKLSVAPSISFPPIKKRTGATIGRVTNIRNQSHILEKIRIQRELCDDDEWGACSYRTS